MGRWDGGGVGGVGGWGAEGGLKQPLNLNSSAIYAFSM